MPNVVTKRRLNTKNDAKGGKAVLAYSVRGFNWSSAGSTALGLWQDTSTSQDLGSGKLLVPGSQKTKKVSEPERKESGNRCSP